MLFNKKVIGIYSLPGDLENQLHTGSLPAKLGDLAGLFILKLLG